MNDITEVFTEMDIDLIEMTEDELDAFAVAAATSDEIRELEAEIESAPAGTGRTDCGHLPLAA